MMQGYLDANLCTTPYFRNLEQSERAAVCFLLGQAFTLWFAQELMSIAYLVHVQGMAKWTPTGAGITPKSGAGVPKGKSRPDFIGFAGMERHVFETKGRTRGIYDKLMRSALAQVSKIATINGKPPATRV